MPREGYTCLGVELPKQGSKAPHRDGRPPAEKDLLCGAATVLVTVTDTLSQSVTTVTLKDTESMSE